MIASLAYAPIVSSSPMPEHRCSSSWAGCALGLSSLAPRVLKLDPDLPLGYARDLDILPNTLPPERHIGYAVQWFGLAGAVFVTALVLTWRSRRGARQGR